MLSESNTARLSVKLVSVRVLKSITIITITFSGESCGDHICELLLQHQFQYQFASDM